MVKYNLLVVKETVTSIGENAVSACSPTGIISAGGEGISYFKANENYCCRLFPGAFDSVGGKYEN